MDLEIVGLAFNLCLGGGWCQSQSTNRATNCDACRHCGVVARSLKTSEPNLL
jgi:hypothetical protein